MTAMQYNKIIDISDFGDPKLRGYIEQVATDEMVRFGLDKPEIVPDSKQWECAMALRSFDDLDVLKPGKLFVGLGAGTEQTTFAVAAKGCLAFPVDRYLENTPWSDVAPAAMMVRPQQYSNIDTTSGAVIPIHGDARHLALPSNTFDGVYSSGSIGHFGSLEAVAAAAEEIGRILKPGGVASLSTEFRLEGPNGIPWFDDDYILFTRELIQDYIIGPSGLEAVDDLGSGGLPTTYDSEIVILDFLERKEKIPSAYDKRNSAHNVVMFHNGFLFCSVHICLRKPAKAAVATAVHATKFRQTVDRNNLAAAAVLSEQIKVWRENYLRDGSTEALQSMKIATLQDALASELAERKRVVRHMFAVESRIVTEAERNKAVASAFDVTWVEKEYFPAVKLYSIIGTMERNECRSKGASGALSYGPYTQFDVGHYCAVFELSADGGGSTVNIDACFDQGSTMLASASLASANLSSFPSLEFAVEESRPGLEFRVLVEGRADVALKGIRVMKRGVTPS